MTAFNYIDPPPLAQPALTPHSTAADAAGLVEVLKLITDPKAHQTALAERQQIVAERADLARQWVELRKAKAAQQEELARLRAEQARALEIDKENHLSALRQREEKFAAEVKELDRILSRWE